MNKPRPDMTQKELEVYIEHTCESIREDFLEAEMTAELHDELVAALGPIVNHDTLSDLIRSTQTYQDLRRLRPEVALQVIVLMTPEQRAQIEATAPDWLRDATAAELEQVLQDGLLALERVIDSHFKSPTSTK